MKFEEFDLHQDLLAGVRDLGFEQPTPIQVDAIPPAMDGRDLLAAAETGSGKTAAFLLPILHQMLTRPSSGTRALVLSPTRELAAQIQEQFQDLAAHTELRSALVMGGVAMGPQDRAFKDKVEIIVATPGRLLDHFQNRGKQLNRLEWLVLDEADRMLDMGFLPDITRILERLPAERQSLLFSATMPQAIISLAGRMLKDPVSINIERTSRIAEGISHVIYRVRERRKRALLLELLKRDAVEHALVFTRTKDGADRLADYLERNGVPCARIHGDLSQSQRTQSLSAFRDKRQWVLIATDIAARGIDVEDISHVVNFDAPETPEDYIHRVGRTGRAEQTGNAVTFICAKDLASLHLIESVLGEKIPRRTLEGFDYEAEDEPEEVVDLAQRVASAQARRQGSRDKSEKPKGKRRGGRGGGRRSKGREKND